VVKADTRSLLCQTRDRRVTDAAACATLSASRDNGPRHFGACRRRRRRRCTVVGGTLCGAYSQLHPHCTARARARMATSRSCNSRHVSCRSLGTTVAFRTGQPIAVACCQERRQKRIRPRQAFSSNQRSNSILLQGDCVALCALVIQCALASTLPGRKRVHVSVQGSGSVVSLGVATDL
jgi:hypothetical protein